MSACTKMVDVPLDKPYLDVPGTTVFDADQARQHQEVGQAVDAQAKERVPITWNPDRQFHRCS